MFFLRSERSVGLLDRLASRRPEHGPVENTAARVEDLVFSTKALRKFLSILSTKDGPTLLDLGPVVGPNIAFFGEQLGCKVLVEDVSLEIERHTRTEQLEALPAFLSKQFPQPDGSIDGILCWDVMDHLDRPGAQALAEQLMRLLKPEGALLAFFGTAQPHDAHYTRYIIVDDTSMKCRPYGATRERQSALVNRDIIRLFERLRVSDSFLLQNHLREILFRKPAYETS
ncbi:MAG: class I SAM-dependent methyltransferase [Vicinamibacterales bacterium]